MKSLLWALLDLASGLPSCGFSRIGAGAVRSVALDDFQNHVKLNQSFLPLSPAVQPGELSLRASNEGLRRPRVARATEVGVLTPHPPHIFASGGGQFSSACLPQ